MDFSLIKVVDEGDLRHECKRPNAPKYLNKLAILAQSWRFKAQPHVAFGTQSVAQSGRNQLHCNLKNNIT